MSQFIHTKLNNGATVVIEPAKDTNTVSIGFAFNIGSRYETIEEHGISHLLEHNIFKGTEEHSAEQIAARADNIGADMNAYTNKETTLYHLTGMAQHSKEMVSLLCDMTSKSVFPEGKYITERKTVIQEIEMGDDNPHRVLNNNAFNILYPDQPFGRNVIGPAHNIANMPRQRMIDFYQENYNASALTISVAGNVQPSDILEHLEYKLQALPQNTSRSFQSAVFGTPQYRHIQKDDMSQNIITISYPGPAKTDVIVPALILGSNILGNGFTSRLYQNIREKHGLVYSISCNPYLYTDTGMFDIDFSTSGNQCDDALSILKDTVDHFADSITQEELERVRVRFNTSSALSNELVQSRMQRNLFYTATFGAAKSLQQEMDISASVTLADTKEAIKSVLSCKPAMVSIGNTDIGRSYQRFGL